MFRVEQLSRPSKPSRSTVHISGRLLAVQSHGFDLALGLTEPLNALNSLNSSNPFILSRQLRVCHRHSEPLDQSRPSAAEPARDGLSSDHRISETGSNARYGPGRGAFDTLLPLPR